MVIGGVVLYGYLPFLPLPWYFSCTLLLLAGAYALVLVNRQIVFLSWLLLLLVFVTSLLSCSIADVRNHPSHILFQAEDANVFRIKLLEVPDDNSKGYRVMAEVKAVRMKDKWFSTQGKMLVFLDTSPAVKQLSVYDELIFTKKPDRIRKAKNPGAVDFSGIYKRRDAYHQVTLKKGEWQKITKEHNRFEVLLATLKMRSLEIIDAYVKDRESAALTKAMLIGYRNDLDTEVVTSFTETGVVHILAVSGMHVGIVLVFARYLFHVITFGLRKKSMFSSAGIISLLWLYALVTGLSSPVVRAVLMFTFFEVATLFRYKTDPYNILASSAAFILLWSPGELYNVGFQLSYAAMVGIFAFYKPLRNIYISRYAVMDYIWSVIAVSLAAQVGTLAISLYYFHQFPLYFLLCNLLTLPVLVPLITGGSFALMLLVFIPPLALLLGNVLHYSCKAMITVIAWVQELPHAVIRHLYVDGIDAFLLSLLTVLLALFITHYRKIWLKALLGNLALCLIYPSLRWIYQDNRKAFYVYYSKEISAAAYVEGHCAYLYFRNGKELRSPFWEGTVLAHLRAQYVNHIEWMRMRTYSGTTTAPHDFLLLKDNALNLSRAHKQTWLICMPRQNFKKSYSFEDSLLSVKPHVHRLYKEGYFFLDLKSTSR